MLHMDQPQYQVRVWFVELRTQEVCLTLQKRMPKQKHQSKLNQQETRNTYITQKETTRFGDMPRAMADPPIV